jgi:glycogen operon protein
MGRTQRGNNNGYCHDSELTWVHWDLGEREQELLDFARAVLRIRRSNPVFRRRRFFAGVGGGRADVEWLRSDAKPMQATDWADRGSRALAMLIHGDASDEVDERGRPNLGKTLLLLLNGGRRARSFALPLLPTTGQWHEVINTASPGNRVPKGQGVNVAPHSLVLLCYEGT